MALQPRPGEILSVDGVDYRFTLDPENLGTVLARRGRQSTVYQLLSAAGFHALKIFDQPHRAPSLVGLNDRVGRFGRMPGLQACARITLSPRRHAAVLRGQPELTYAAIMPWVAGPSWQETVHARRPLAPEQCLALTHGLTEALSAMEERGIAHCDLSGSNLILPGLVALGELYPVALVDVEGLYAPGFDPPTVLAGSGSGYQHPVTPLFWGPDADRFAGGLLAAEILAWSSESVRNAAAGPTYFALDEMQTDCPRFRLLIDELRERWGDQPASLLTRLWESELPSTCPPFGEWLLALPPVVADQREGSNYSTPPAAPPSHPTATPGFQIRETIALGGSTPPLAPFSPLHGPRHRGAAPAWRSILGKHLILKVGLACWVLALVAAGGLLFRPGAGEANREPPPLGRPVGGQFANATESSFGSIAAFGSVSGSPPPSLPAACTHSNYVYHVKPGDTFDSIARNCGMTRDELLALNRGVTRPDDVPVGLALALPTPPPAPNGIPAPPPSMTPIPQVTAPQSPPTANPPVFTSTSTPPLHTVTPTPIPMGTATGTPTPTATRTPTPDAAAASATAEAACATAVAAKVGPRWCFQ